MNSSPGRCISVCLLLSSYLGGCAALNNFLAVETEPTLAVSEEAVVAADFQEQASAALQRYDFRAALRALRVAQTLQPGDSALRQQIAELEQQLISRASLANDEGDRLKRAGQRKAASRQFLTALQLDPQNAYARQALKAIEQDLVDRRQARNTRNASARAAVEDQALRQSTSAQTASQSQDETVAVLKPDAPSMKVRKSEVTNCEEESKNARQLVRGGKLDTALDTFFQVRGCAAKPALAQLQDELAQAFFDQGFRIFESDIDGAIEAWQNALSVEPNHALAKVKLRNAVKIRDFMQGLDKQE